MHWKGEASSASAALNLRGAGRICIFPRFQLTVIFSNGIHPLGDVDRSLPWHHRIALAAVAEERKPQARAVNKIADYFATGHQQSNRGLLNAKNSLVEGISARAFQGARTSLQSN